MRIFHFFPFFCIFLAILASCGERANEKILAEYPHGTKKISVQEKADGTIVKRETWHYNGIRESAVPYENGKPNGNFTRWTSHGDIAETGTYIDGLREGEWTEWFSNGKPETRGFYKAGKKQGKWTGHHYGGGIAWEREYANGQKTGTWKEYDKSGTIRKIDSCFPETASGTLETFLDNGKRIRTEHCKNGLLDGIVETHYPGSALETRTDYTLGSPNGKQELYRATGAPWRTAYFKNGVRDSVWTYYDDSGNAIRQSKFKNGNGKAYSLPGNGVQESETTFVNNKIEDTLRYKLPGHDLDYEEIWKDGEKKQLISRYAKDRGGRIASEGNFQDGKRNGFWRNWYPNGKIKDSLFYKGDSLYGEQLYFDSTGKVYLRKGLYGKGQMTIGFE